MTQNLNQDTLENTFGVIRLNCGSDDNPTVGRFVDALKTSIINGLAFRGLGDTNCEDDGATLLDNLQSFLKEPDAALQNPSTSHGKETPDTVPESFHVAEQVQKNMGSAVHAGDMEVFSVANVSGSIARQVLRGVSCFVNQRFGGMYRLHLQLVHRSWIASTLKMEAVCSSETSVNKIPTWRHIP
jgi:hypothetical protein